MRLRGAFLLVIAVGVAAATYVRAPAVLAWICPGCYGLVELEPGLHADPAMTLPERASLQSSVNEARRLVAGFFGSYDRDPTLLICTTAECDERLGSGDAAARAFGDQFIHVSRFGANTTTLAHEFAHIELHARVGLVRFFTGKLPAWFDEGMAVVASRDADALRISGFGLPRCRVEPAGPLPTRRSEWNHSASGLDSTLYPQAACAVVRWIEAQGGRRDALRAMEAAGWDPARFLAGE